MPETMLGIIIGLAVGTGLALLWGLLLKYDPLARLRHRRRERLRQRRGGY